MFRFVALALCLPLMLLVSCGGTASEPKASQTADLNQSAYEADPTGWTDLMPSADLGGWSRMPIPTDKTLGAQQWFVRDGMLVLEADGEREWLRYDGKQFQNFIAHVEWRFRKVEVEEGEPRYNGGVYFWAEPKGAQFYQAQTGQAGGWLFGDFPKDGDRNRTNLRDQMGENRVKPVGEWNTYEIHATPQEIRLWVNGAVQSRWENPPLTGGYFGLEAEGYYMEFRKLLIKELP